MGNGKMGKKESRKFGKWEMGNGKIGKWEIWKVVGSRKEENEKKRTKLEVSGI